MRTCGALIFSQIEDVLLLIIDLRKTGVDLTDLGIFFRLGAHVFFYESVKFVFVSDS